MTHMITLCDLLEYCNGYAILYMYSNLHQMVVHTLALLPLTSCHLYNEVIGEP